MKTVNLFLIVLFYSVSYPQSDEIKLLNQTEKLYGKVIIIKTSVIEFKQDSTGFIYELDKKDINYLKPANGDTIWFNKLDESVYLQNSGNGQNFSFGIKRATVFLSYNFLGKHKVTSGGVSGDPNVNSGISLGIEFDFIKAETDVVNIGFGAIYQFSRKQINSNGGFNFIPLYAFFKLYMISGENAKAIKAYLVPAFGYNFFYGDKKYTGGLEINGGVYNSFGLGILVGNKLDVKLLYQFNRGYMDANDKKIEILYRSLDLHCGYYF
ncbi:MAG: hypothetical protein A2V93_10550 [Ignavibacteria bacterium RBG_16_34_14]|nr:MAG: hypothetical protein A2V93_10550 [Ignavibacteria bacterium RBG_16_34_14]